MKKIALIAEYDRNFEPHVATERALLHSIEKMNAKLEYEWVSTENIDESLFEKYQGAWIGPGSPYKNMGNTLAVIKKAREDDIPLLGTCGGFQHVILETARNVLNFSDADHAEYDPYGSRLFISELECSLAGREMKLSLAAGSQAAIYYGTMETVEEYYCNFGVNPEYVGALKNSPLEIVGSDSEGEIRIVEIPTNRFFLATLFVPQVQSTPEHPHPLVNAFVQSISE